MPKSLRDAHNELDYIVDRLYQEKEFSSDDERVEYLIGKYEEIILSPENYFLVTIPPLIWNGFKGLDNSESIIANCLNLPHNENEMVRESYSDKKFNYNWK